MIRDQKPLHEGKLASCLDDGLTPQDWLQILNGRVFFWVRDHRVIGLSNAEAYRGSRQMLITVDTTRLLERYANEILLSPMNSGATRPMAFPRGRSTFRTIADYPFEERRKVRGPKDAIAELTVRYAIPDISDLAMRVEEFGGDRPRMVLWERDP